MQPLETLSGKVVFVTGGARGLGAAICSAAAGQGATVVLADINGTQAGKSAENLMRDGARAMGIELDVGDERSVAAGLEQTVARFGRVDAVINNAAIDVTLPIEELEVAAWERVLRTNLTGPFLVAKAAAARMRRQGGGGHIVNITSTAARRAWPNASVYHASKWGLLGLSHALHAELRPHRIKVTAILAGGMRTPFLLDRFPDIDVETLQDPANVARAVCFALTQPDETVIPEMMVLPMRETSWP
jgi:NAD(P)-dependent dehydrogenase (short-subunit alcohol dehydrogenase family)